MLVNGTLHFFFNGKKIKKSSLNLKIRKGKIKVQI